MAGMELIVNGEKLNVDADSDTPLLWVLRDSAGLTGTKYGCGMALCGACTVLVDGQPVRSCSTPVASLKSGQIVTIEGLKGKVGAAVQQAWAELSVPQCGYCQSGQIMSATALLTQKANPNEQEIEAAMSGNICRCGTYPTIRKAIQKASEMLR